MEKFNEVLNGPTFTRGLGRKPAGERQWGADMLTQGGYLVHTWGDPAYKFQSASLGKCITRALFGLSVEAGLLHPDEPICKTWTGRGQLSPIPQVS